MLKVLEWKGNNNDAFLEASFFSAISSLLSSVRGGV